MTLYLFIYLSIALSELSTDAALCFATKRRFKLLIGIIGALLWPVTIPVLVLFIWRKTRHCPPLTKDDFR